MTESSRQTTPVKSFSEVANEVIRNSIRSAICIDDRYASAYEEDISGLNTEEPRKLHSSFRKEGLCDLDIYRFKTFEETWNRDFMLANKDLLILDWELDVGGGYDSAVKILSEVIESKKIPFVVVYTSTLDLHSVNKALICEFTPYDTEVFQLISVALRDNFAVISSDPDSIEADVFLEDTAQVFYEYIFNWKIRDAIEKDLIMAFIKCFLLKETVGVGAIKTKITAALKTVMGANGDGLLELAMITIAQQSRIKSPYRIERISTDQHAFRLNGTIVYVYHKQEKPDGIRPEDLFKIFAEAVVSDPHNYLNILSLELKDSLRESFSMIGTQFSKTDEKAFFFHLENYRTLNNGKDYDLRSIYDFILKSWIGELHQQKINEQSAILQFANDRYIKLPIQPSKPLSKSDADLINELVKYCAYVSTSMVKNRSDPSLRFGDIFLNQEDPDEYFLCITPSCDCLHSDKINDNFYFVRGSIYNNFNGIQKAETEFLSFVLQNGEPKCISWKCKPFTSYVTINDIDQLRLNYCGSEIQLKHLIILKENFTQRIANHSFGYGHRVGIDLPH